MLWSLMLAATALAGPGPGSPPDHRERSRWTRRSTSSRSRRPVRSAQHAADGQPRDDGPGHVARHAGPALRVAGRRLVPRLPGGPGGRQGPAGAPARHAPPDHGELQPAPAALLGGRAADGRGHRDRRRGERPQDDRRADDAGDEARHVRRLAQRHRQGPRGRVPQAHHAVDAQEPESAAGQLPAHLHGREPDGRREQHLRRAAGQVDQVATSSPCRSAAGCSASAGTCTTTASACGWRTRRPAR